MSRFEAIGPRVGIRRPTADDCDEFIALMQISHKFHEPWGDWAKDSDRYLAYLQSRQAPTEDGFLICENPTGQILGLVNLNCIVRGHFHSAYLGYAIGAPYAGKGYMTEALNLVIGLAFSQMQLHRLEANIQPANLASIALVKRCGFKKEGFSPRYLEVQREWRDHERWAILAD